MPVLAVGPAPLGADDVAQRGGAVVLLVAVRGVRVRVGHGHQHRVGGIVFHELHNKPHDIIRGRLRMAPILPRRGGGEPVFLRDVIDGVGVLLKQGARALVGGIRDHVQRQVLVLKRAVLDDIGGDVELDEAERVARLVLRGRAHVHAGADAVVGDGLGIVPGEELPHGVIDCGKLRLAHLVRDRRRGSGGRGGRRLGSGAIFRCRGAGGQRRAPDCARQQGGTSTH